ncbi:MAG: metal ABC transporter permease [bacterium]
MNIIEIFQYGFMQRAFLAGSFIAMTCAVLGMFLVLRKMSLIGDGLSHVSFGAIALGLFLGIYPIYIAIPIAIIGSLIILKISQQAKVYGDAAIGMVSSVGIASGVILAGLSKGFNVDLFSYLFGNILAISTTEVVMAMILSGFVLFLIYLFYWELFSISFDEEYAQASGINTGFINALLAILAAITVVLSVKVVGIMLVSALLIFPAVTALQLAKRFQTTIFFAMVIALLSVIIGIILSFSFNLPTGAMIIILNAILFGLAMIWKKLG